MVDYATMVRGMMTLDCYWAVLKVLRSINDIEKEIIPDYERSVEPVFEGLKQVKGAFASREFLKNSLDYKISDERIEEFEDFLNGKKNTLFGLDEEISEIDNLYKSMEYLN